MSLSSFDNSHDPGPNFLGLVKRTGVDPFASAAGAAMHLSHATTCVALRFIDGVIMASDRRATSGNLISHRNMEKLYAADSHSGVAIAGAAGPAMEMVRLFQLQLEHYEKVEGSQLTLDGKANQLSQMIRANLPAAMQGMVVVPIFAGFDIDQQRGRLFQFDVTGGRYEEASHVAAGSGSLHAGTVIKIGFADQLTKDQATDLAVRALFEAADSDSATGGPDLVRGIYPMVAQITSDGFAPIPEAEIAQRFSAVVDQQRSAS